MNRREQIDEIIQACLADLSAGQIVDPASVATAFPDLMPELLTELKLVFEHAADADVARSTVSDSESGDRTFIVSPDALCPDGLSPGRVNTDPVNHGDTQQAPCLTTEEVSAWSQGVLDAAHHRRLQQHVAECNACRTELAEQLEFAALAGEDGAFRQAGPADAHPAFDLANHEFLELIDTGGQGQVWLCRHTHLSELRAVKLVLLSNFTGRGDFNVGGDFTGRELAREDQQNRDHPAIKADSGLDRLLEEARIMGRLPRHVHRMILHDCVVAPPYLALVMEFIDGPSLSSLVARQGPIDWADACRYVAEIASGLEDVHAAGVLHRDIKPANILLDKKTDRAVLVDFGLAATASAIREHGGTPGYLPPELLTGQVSETSDVFSLAATLFFLGTGATAFDAKNANLSLRQARAGLHSEAAVWADVPVAVRDALLAGLDPSPDRRASLAEFAEQVRSAHLQSLADSLNLLEQRSGNRLRVAVSTAKPASSEFVEHAGFAAAGSREPVVVETGDFVRFDVATSRDGYLTVVNLDSSGDIDVVFPPDRGHDSRLTPQQPHELVLQLSPPAGSERMAFLWTSERMDLEPQGWRTLIEQQVAGLPAEARTRGMQLVSHEVVDSDSNVPAVKVVTVRHSTPSASREASQQRSITRSFSADAAAGEPTQSTVPPESESSQRLRISAPAMLRHEGENVVTLTLPPAWDRPLLPHRNGPWEFCLSAPGCLPVRVELANEDSSVESTIRFSLQLSQGPTSHGQSGTNAQITLLSGQNSIPVAAARFPLAIERASAVERVAPDSAGDRASVNYRRLDSDLELSPPFRTAYVGCCDADRARVRSQLDRLSGIPYVGSGLRTLRHTSGERWEHRIVLQSMNADVIILFLSIAALDDPWFLEELALIQRGFAESDRPVVIATLLDDDSGTDAETGTGNWPRRLQPLVAQSIPDLFGKW